MSAILACTDGSLYAPSIYQHAAWAARQYGIPIRVVHVIERDETSGPRDLSGSLGFDAGDDLLEELARHDESHARMARLRGKAILEDARKQLAGHEVVLAQRHGSVVETLDGFEGDAAMVIIGKRGEHADFAQGHLGSNLERVVRSSRTPVMVVARQFRPIRRFMIAYDGGPSVGKALQHLAESPLLRDCECHLLRVGGERDEPEWLCAAATLREAGFSVTADCIEGHADEVVCREVVARNVDLLVMGAYGHSRVRNLILGSTTTHLIRTCHVPVLMFR